MPDTKSKQDQEDIIYTVTMKFKLVEWKGESNSPCESCEIEGHLCQARIGNDGNGKELGDLCHDGYFVDVTTELAHE